MTVQLALLDDLETRIKAAAKRWGITDISFHDDRVVTFRAVKNGGASGPDLDDFEAAVLIAAGYRWRVVHPWRPE